MRFIIEALLRGDPVSDWFTAAKQHWTEVLKDVKSADEIVDLASCEQSWFENVCGGRDVGQEIMVASGIAMYYTTACGFDADLPKAKAMYIGLSRSTCSSEILDPIQNMAMLYPELNEM